MERCLSPLHRPAWRDKFNLRLIWNDLSDEAQKVFLRHTYQFESEGQLEVCMRGEAPYWKYPAMRRLFYEHQLQSPLVMWFDDDSYIRATAPNHWFESVEAVMRGPTKCAMLGGKYNIRLRGNQHLFIRDQPWYNGKPVEKGQPVTFITGGWWAIRTDVLQKYDWPPANFEHNGGDVMLGELCRQHNLHMINFHEHVGVNCDHTGKMSTAPRRGFSQRPIGTDYKRPESRNWMDILDGTGAHS